MKQYKVLDRDGLVHDIKADFMEHLHDTAVRLVTRKEGGKRKTVATFLNPVSVTFLNPIPIVELELEVGEE